MSDQKQQLYWEAQNQQEKRQQLGPTVGLAAALGNIPGAFAMALTAS